MAGTLDLLQGTLDLLVLKTLSWGPAHGYAVARWIQQLTGDVLQVGEGSLYPALHRLEERGWIESEWRRSENNRRAKFYRLTPAGRRQLTAETAVCSTTSAPNPVGRRRVWATRPSSPMATASVFVPPMSMPTLTAVFLPAGCAAPPRRCGMRRRWRCPRSGGRGPASPCR